MHRLQFSYVRAPLTGVGDVKAPPSATSFVRATSTPHFWLFPVFPLRGRDVPSHEGESVVSATPPPPPPCWWCGGRARWGFAAEPPAAPSRGRAHLHFADSLSQCEWWLSTRILSRFKIVAEAGEESPGVRSRPGRHGNRGPSVTTVTVGLPRWRARQAASPSAASEVLCTLVSYFRHLIPQTRMPTGMTRAPYYLWIIHSILIFTSWISSPLSMHVGSFHS